MTLIFIYSFLIGEILCITEIDSLHQELYSLIIMGEAPLQVTSLFVLYVGTQLNLLDFIPPRLSTPPLGSYPLPCSFPNQIKPKLEIRFSQQLFLLRHNFKVILKLVFFYEYSLTQ